MRRPRPERPVIVLHVDDFFNAAEVRHARGRYSPEGFWLDTYNYDALAAEALAPLSRCGSGVYRSASFTREAGTPERAPARRAPDDAVVIVEGVFLHRPELVGCWDSSIWLDVSFDEAQRRMNERAGTDLPSVLLRRDFEAQRIYFRTSSPWCLASIVVDNNNLQDPQVIAPADSAAARGD